jgi:hypothetical protein
VLPLRSHNDTNQYGVPLGRSLFRPFDILSETTKIQKHDARYCKIMMEDHANTMRGLESRVHERDINISPSHSTFATSHRCFAFTRFRGLALKYTETTKPQKTRDEIAKVQGEGAMLISCPRILFSRPRIVVSRSCIIVSRPRLLISVHKIKDVFRLVKEN